MVLVNCLNGENFFAMVSDASVDMVHVFDGQKDDAAFVAPDRYQLEFLEFLLQRFLRLLFLSSQLLFGNIFLFLNYGRLNYFGIELRRNYFQELY